MLLRQYTGVTEYHLKLTKEQEPHKRYQYKGKHKNTNTYCPKYQKEETNNSPPNPKRLYRETQSI